MKVLFCASEALPFSATGGLADVAGSLPQALRTRLIGCRVVLPLYDGVPQELRAGYILKTTGNPYCFRVGDLGVKLEFLDSAPSLQDALSDFFQRKKSGL